MSWIAVLFPYRTHLEQELKQLRADFTERLADKNVQLRQLRGELAAAKTAKEYLPKEEPAAAVAAVPLIKPHIDMPQDWVGELRGMLEEEIEKEDK